jgi:phage/plasmid-associated DNA primase
MRRGAFTLPPSVAAATARFKIEADPLRGFIAERIEFRHENNAPFVPRTEVYMAYGLWASENGYHGLSAQRFYSELQAAIVDSTPHRFLTLTLHGTDGYKGIALL